MIVKNPLQEGRVLSLIPTLVQRVTDADIHRHDQNFNFNPGGCIHKLGNSDPKSKDKNFYF